MEPRAGLVLLGAGGHAKVLLATLQAAGREVLEVLDDDQARWGTSLLGCPISGPIDGNTLAPGHPAILGIGDNRVRQRLAGLDLSWPQVVHPDATVHSSVLVGDGSVVFAGAVIQPEVTLGRHVIVNTGATVDHDCRLGDFAHIAPGCHLAGQVRVDEGALLGIGAAVVPGVSIGAWATVGAGAVVLHDVAAGSVVAGAPARVLGSSR